LVDAAPHAEHSTDAGRNDEQDLYVAGLTMYATERTDGFVKVMLN
jgi:hypothetical protein